VATAEQALQWVNRLYDRLSTHRPEDREAVALRRRPAAARLRDRGVEEVPLGPLRRLLGQLVRRRRPVPVDRLRIDGFRLGDSTDVVTTTRSSCGTTGSATRWRRSRTRGSCPRRREAVRGAGVGRRERRARGLLGAPGPGRRRLLRDRTAHRLAALKAWVEDGYEYATLYLPDEVWKFERPRHDARTPGSGSS
jgi:hypothetical protein